MTDTAKAEAGPSSTSVPDLSPLDRRPRGGANEDFLHTRAAYRYKIFQPGTWQRTNCKLPLHLLDISLTGARGYAVIPPTIGSRVSIDCGVALGFARISWIEGKLFGAQFVVPLGMDVIDQVTGARQRMRDRLKNISNICI